MSQLWELVFSDGSKEITSARTKEAAQNLGERKATQKGLELSETKLLVIPVSHRPAVQREPGEEG